MMKAKRKIDVDDFEPNEIDELAKNCVIALGLFIGTILIFLILGVLVMFAASALNNCVEIEEITHIIQEQCNIADYRRYDYDYLEKPDHTLIYSDHVPDKNLRIECEKGFQSDWQWQCTCTERD